LSRAKGRVLWCTPTAKQLLAELFPQVFVKLGVENRTSAAARAVRALAR
jgi:hypothetical protein